MSLFKIGPATNMVYDFLGSTPSQSGFLSPQSTPVTSFSGTSLAPDFGKNIFSNLPDYSRVFQQAASGLSSLGGTSAPQPAPSRKRATSQRRSGGVSYGGASGYGGVQNRPIEFNLGAPPEMLKLEVPYEEFTRRLAEVNKPGDLAALAEQYNAPTRQAFESYLPEFRPGLSALGGLAKDYMAGRLPASVAQQIARSTAAANLQTGLGGGGLGRALTARDIGRTSLELQGLGADLFGRSVALTQQAMQLATPISVANLMVSPGQVYDTMITQAQYNQQIANQNLLNAWQSQALPGQYVLGKGFQTFTPGVYSSTRPLDPSIQLNWGSDVKGVDLQGRPLAGRPIGGLAGAALRAQASSWTPVIAGGSLAAMRG